MKTGNINQLSFEEEISNMFAKESSFISQKTKSLLEEVIKNDIKIQIVIKMIVNRIYIEQNSPSVLDGFIYQKIFKESSDKSKQELRKNLPNGIVSINKSTNVNYRMLEHLLINGTFEEADRLTQKYLCQLVSNQTEQEKKWLYFTDIQLLPKTDLYTIDLMWRIYSQGKFGFSVQKKLWINNKEKWDDLWEKIKWTHNGAMKRYPKEFIWTIDAPEGHLPLFNQLRGTQTLACLFRSIEW